MSFLKKNLFENFYRAQKERPGYQGVELGMSKSKSAIENSLSTCLDFMEMKDVIEKIISDPTLDLGYEFSPPEKTEYDITKDPEV